VTRYSPHAGQNESCSVAPQLWQWMSPGSVNVLPRQQPAVDHVVDPQHRTRVDAGTLDIGKSALRDVKSIFFAASSDG
jgi:hypothetical protein